MFHVKHSSAPRPAGALFCAGTKFSLKSLFFFCGAPETTAPGGILLHMSQGGELVPATAFPAQSRRRSMKALRRDVSMRAELPAYEPLNRFRCPNFSMRAERSRKASWTEVSSSGACGDGFAFSRQDDMVFGALRLEARFALRQEAKGRGRKKRSGHAVRSL